MSTPPPAAPASARRTAGMKGFLVLAVLLGLLAGVGGYTLIQAEALSYLSSKPEVCANCHIMWPQYEGWQKSSHHTVATCVDCHLPANFVGKYTMKALNGYHHSVGFTLQNFHEPIQIKPRNDQVLQANCKRCHEQLVHELVTSAQSGREELRCTRCHTTVGHGDPVGLGGPERETEIHSASAKDSPRD